MPSSPATAALKLVCPDGWQVLPLADVAYFQEGPGILAKDFREAGVPLLRLKGVEGDYVTLDGCNYLDPEMVARKWNHFRVELGDLLISTSASLGRVSVVTNESAGGVPYTGLIRFKPRDPRLLAGYLKTFLGSLAFVEQAESMASGSVIRHFGPSHIRQMAILLPPLDQQARIGELATVFDERLRLLRQTNATLESIAQALFKSWFIDFDPVRAKAEGREPEGMDAATAALFPAEFEESELGPIPRGWAPARLSDAIVIRDGKPWASDNRVDTSNVKVFGANGPVGFALESLGSGRVVFLGKIGSCGALNSCNGEWWATNNVFYISKALNEQLEWCRHILMAIDFKGYIGGSSNPYMPLKNFGHHSVLMPSLELRSKFESVASTYRGKAEANQRQVDLLAQVRDCLLPRLISGKLRLPEAQAQLEDALA